MRILATLFAGLLGLAFGSFLNVCLSRWPAGESIVKPASHCRACGRTLSWWENIPLLSWIVLRGRCRTCHASISWRYPLVELAVGVLWAVEASRVLPELLDSRIPPILISCYGVQLLGQWIFLWLLIALLTLDASELWLPDWLTLPGILAGFALLQAQAILVGLSPFHDTSKSQSVWYEAAQALKHSLDGAAVAGGLILLIRWIYWLVRRREGIGLGDAKLMAMLGAWLGFPGALLSFVIGVLLGALVALIALALPRREGQTWAATKLPLGTFLCIGGIIAALWGEPILNAYLGWSGL